MKPSFAAGKGARPRPYNGERYREGYDAIFNKHSTLKPTDPVMKLLNKQQEELNCKLATAALDCWVDTLKKHHNEQNPQPS